ncbi:hypothetical protein IT774_05165 [Salinimonas marina]|uniref:Uncharacterized protein n=1 Tax=Salinimonas marina TaxID=2785918 RepID=A0A7S9DZ17_9ALTE|nr:hypothetical protein [Salinimonas marina]QPG06564.1 hypothetical protein IT774_05165 [Salinimonas marina]
MFLHFPSTTPSRSGFRVVPMAQITYNPFNNVETVYEEPGEKWEADLEWFFLTQAESRDFRTFLNKHVNYGRFYLRDSAHENLGSWGGTIQVDGANQDGRILAIKNATASKAIAPAGDRFTLDGFLYELTEDATANSSGKATLKFTPELRTRPVSGTALIKSDPYGTFMLKTPASIPTFSRTRLGARDMSLSFVEALRP